MVSRMTLQRLYVTGRSVPAYVLTVVLDQFCTTAFIVEIAQYIKFAEMSREDNNVMPIDVEMGRAAADVPALEITSLPSTFDFSEDVPRTKEEEDAILKNVSEGFADWVAAFLRRVILLFENLPEEGANGSAGGTTEGLPPIYCTSYPD